MTINELYEKALEIESKYTSDSNLSLYINKTRYQNGMIRYQLKHEGSGKIVDTGYGITNIRELLTVFDMGMAARYRFRDAEGDNLTID
jgi:hypothetical protein